MRKQRRLGVSRRAGTVLSLALLVTPASAAPRLAPADEPAEPTEAALPDIAALERGEVPRASVSFQPGVAASAPAGATAPVKRLSATPAPGLESPRGGVYGLDPTSFGAETMRATNTAGGAAPDQHVVKKGDTLWDVCGSYYNDPWRWPRLWAMNPHVTNPHWIFPGDVLRTSDGSQMAPAAPRASTGGLVITSNRKGTLDSRAVVLRQYGFIDANALTVSGRIVGSREEKIMLGTGDQAYIGFPPEQPLRAGDRYTVFAPDDSQPVYTETGKVLGYLVRVYGDVEIDQISDKAMARGSLLETVEPIERGFRVSPAVRQFKRVEPVAAGVSTEARVVASFSAARMLAADTFVVLSRGLKDGLQVGNRAFVVRRGDGYRPVRDGWDTHDPRFPKELVGELWVVDVRETAAVAWIARTTKEIRVGETVELRKGH